MNIGNNDINHLPNLLGLHPVLKTLQIDGNPMKSIRRAVIEKGADAIMKFLRDKYVEGNDDVVETWALEMEKESHEYSS